MATYADDNGYRTTIAVACSISMAVVAVSLRFWARSLSKFSIGADDYTMLAAVICTIGTAAAYLFGNKYGGGRRLETIESADLVRFLKTMIVACEFYGLSITLVKISVLLFYRRVFATPQIRRQIYYVGFLVIVWLGVHNLLAALQCTPVQKFWYTDLPGHCIDFLTMVRAVQAVNIALNVLILVLPVKAIMELQLPLDRKLSVIALFLLGGLALVVAIARLAVISEIDKNDFTHGTALASWSVTEPGVEVVSGCLPAMAPLFKIPSHFNQLYTKMRGSSSSSESRSANSSARRSFFRRESQQQPIPVQPAKIAQASQAAVDPFADGTYMLNGLSKHSVHV